MRRTNIYLDDRQLEVLDKLAAEQGISRADLIRRVLDGFLTGRERDLAADLDAIDASFGVLVDVASPGRTHDDRARHLDEIWRRET